MDDLQFRRAIYADPNNQDEETIAAQQADDRKKQFAQDICQLDEKIKQALEIPVPDDLCNKLILRQTLASHKVHKTQKRMYLSIAASVAMVSGLMLHSLQFSSVHTNLSDYALAHVYHEDGKFDNNSNETVSLASLNSKMGAFDAVFNKSLGKLLYADFCRFDGLKSLHLVYQGKTSPVTVFVVPKDEQLSFESSFKDQRFIGSSLGFKESNIIVVSDENESLEQWRKNINDNVNWST